MHVPQIFNVIIVNCWQQTKDAIPNNHSTVGMWRIRNLCFKPVDTGIPETKSHSSGICTILTTPVPSVLWRCWLGIQPVKKTEWWGAGIVICLERSADCIWPSWCHCVCVTTRHCCTTQTTTSSSEQHKDNDVAMLHGRWRHYLHGEMTTMMLPRREATSSRRAVSIAIKLIESSDAIHSMHTWRHGCACVLWMESLLLMSWITAGKRTCNARSVISTLIHWHHVKAVVYC